MTETYAREIKRYRVAGSSIRMIAQRFSDAHPEEGITPGHYIDGIGLLHEAGNFLGEDHWKWEETL